RNATLAVAAQNIDALGVDPWGGVDGGPERVIRRTRHDRTSHPLVAHQFPSGVIPLKRWVRDPYNQRDLFGVPNVGRAQQERSAERLTRDIEFDLRRKVDPRRLAVVLYRFDALRCVRTAEHDKVAFGRSVPRERVHTRVRKSDA